MDKAASFIKTFYGLSLRNAKGLKVEVENEQVNVLMNKNEVLAAVGKGGKNVQALTRVSSLLGGEGLLIKINKLDE